MTLNSKLPTYKEEASKIKYDVKFYTDAKDIVMKSAGDYIELKNYAWAKLYKKELVGLSS